MLNIDSYHFFGAPEVRDTGVHRKLREAMCRRIKRHLWTPADAVSFVPALSRRIYGDGKALMGLTTINSRPRFYILRVDSRWSIDFDVDAPDGIEEFSAYVDAIAFALEDEFGCARYDAGDGEPETDRQRFRRRKWPAFDDENGCSWWRIDWPDLPRVKLAPHPFARHIRVLQ